MRIKVGGISARIYTNLFGTKDTTRLLCEVDKSSLDILFPTRYPILMSYVSLESPSVLTETGIWLSEIFTCLANGQFRLTFFFLDSPMSDFNKLCCE